jgi:hypothetical protein
MFGGGLDREDLMPCDYDGNRGLDTDETTSDAFRGCHVGEYAGLNVGNPQPGFVYSWCEDNDRSRLRVRQSGGQIVQGNDPERAAYSYMTGSAPSSDLDSAFGAFPGVLLVRTPIEVERRKQEIQEAARQKNLRGTLAEQEFIDRGRRATQESDYSRRSGRESLRFVTHGHGYRVTDGPDENDRTLDMWGPSTGILRGD